MSSDDRKSEFETVRQTSLRAFTVKLADGTTEHVFAHYHDAGMSGGHLNFVVIDHKGRQTISAGYNSRVWDKFREVTELSVRDKNRKRPTAVQGSKEIVKNSRPGIH